VGEGKINGLRIDHVDGLFDPGSIWSGCKSLCAGDCPPRGRVGSAISSAQLGETRTPLAEALRSSEQAAALRGPLYVVIEKIWDVTSDPEQWPIRGRPVMSV